MGLLVLISDTPFFRASPILPAPPFYEKTLNLTVYENFKNSNTPTLQRMGFQLCQYPQINDNSSILLFQNSLLSARWKVELNFFVIETLTLLRMGLLHNDENWQIIPYLKKIQKIHRYTKKTFHFQKWLKTTEIIFCSNFYIFLPSKLKLGVVLNETTIRTDML